MHQSPSAPGSSDVDLPILYRDDALIAVHKPAGLLVHRSALATGERRNVVQLLRRQLEQRVYPVHRLDRATSGVLLLALNPHAAAVLGAQFHGRSVRKRYLAIVRGSPPPQGVIHYSLVRAAEDRQSWGIASGSRTLEPLRDAVTHYRRLASVELPHRVDRYPTSRYALLELVPCSGRRHQLRRHMKHVSHPIIGDTTYGKARHNRLFEELFGCRRLCLACVELTILHPNTGVPLRLCAPLASDLAATVRALGWEGHLSTAV